MSFFNQSVAKCFRPIYALSNYKSIQTGLLNNVNKCKQKPINRYFSQKPNKRSPLNKNIAYAFMGLSGTALISSFIYQYFGKHDKPKDFPKQTGYPGIGGDFNLIDHTGHKRSLTDFRGKWLLVYFGFCHCPDICPEQLEKLVEVYDRLAHYKKADDIIPLFITIDPERDTPAVLADYIKDFSDNIVGLTGSKEEIKQVTQKYRIYASHGEKDATGDYIVDHTIISYLFDPNGHCVDLFGRYKSIHDITSKIMTHLKNYAKD